MSNLERHISVNFHCPQQLWQVIQAKADRLGKDPVTVTIDTLNEAFGLSGESGTLATNRELVSIKTRLEAIEAAIQPFLRDISLNQKIERISAEKTPEIHNVSPSISPVAPDLAARQYLIHDDDDIEDEPDEILVDFL
jgi:hypothetical protein